jgi:hypothetical protein
MFDTPLLRQLIRSGKTGELVARGVPGGFVLMMRDGLTEDLLEAQRGGARKFKHLDALASYLQSLGASEFRVELGHWTESSVI